MEVEILVHLTYPGRNHPLIENFITKAHTSGMLCTKGNLCRDRGLRTSPGDRLHYFYTTSKENAKNESRGGKRNAFCINLKGR